MEQPYQKDLGHLSWDQVFARQVMRASLVSAWMDALRLAPGDRALHVPDLEDEEEDEPAPSKAARSNGLSRDQVDALRTVLNDLMECRKLIDAAVARPE